MEYKHLVKDFARRTKSNLVFLESRAGDPDFEVFEVTQLVNSMLGLLVFPKEAFFRHLPPTPLSELAKKGWPAISLLEGDPPCRDLRTLIRYLRNSVAHFNLEFTSDGHVLTGLKVWNTTPDRTTVVWKAVLSLQDLRLLLDKFLELIENMEE
jgi:hypothetical protein